MSASRRIGPRGAGSVLAAPVFLLVTSLAGLVLGLTGDGWRDIAASLLLALPVLTFLRGWLRRS
ncbi:MULTISPECIES: hypothetical protein [unclassified Sphingomonas]|uniref:hypothetical protein n=1 Tax=unclassified Sphingomonas TaxID=196159 RepID=UPI00215196E2|nr:MULTISPECIES: hypothetical protein [unclassified Sphingomonas]MCR5872571.1 hypothetical protein [Sphingomonas sp. J344]UUX99140.1 hypothetical protein LRS08_16920 [Sphingomonas sp. J315]